MGIGFVTTDAEFSNIDLFKVAISAVFNCIGTTGLSMAMESGGKGGPVYSVNSAHVLIPLFLNIMIKRLYPTPLQNFGIVLGAIGVLITAKI